MPVTSKLKVPIAIDRISEDVIHILRESFHKIGIKKSSHSRAKRIKRKSLLRVLSIKIVISRPWLRLLFRIGKLENIVLRWLPIHWLRLSSSNIVVDVSRLRLPINVAIIII